MDFFQFINSIDSKKKLTYWRAFLNQYLFHNVFCLSLEKLQEKSERNQTNFLAFLLAWFFDIMVCSWNLGNQKEKRKGRFGFKLAWAWKCRSSVRFWWGRQRTLLVYEHRPPPLVATVSRSDCRDRLYFGFNLSVNATASTLFALFSFSNRAYDAILFFVGYNLQASHAILAFA